MEADHRERVLADRRWFVANDEQFALFQGLLDTPSTPTPKFDLLMRRESPFDETD